jgi:hypothetical protein
MFVPVHVRERRVRFKPATVVPFFLASGSAAKIPRSVLESPCVLLSRQNKPPVAVNLAETELAVSMFMSTTDNRLGPAFPSKGNATVTFDGFDLRQAGSLVCRCQSRRNKDHP